MKIEDVKKLSPEERFLYWIRERHQVYLRRKVGLAKPWTDDEILQSYFFTNPYRENDKTTVWFRENVREPLRDDPRVLFATVCFRWFNLIETGHTLIRGNLLANWDHDKALGILSAVRAKGDQVFTGAFMINSPGGEPKLEAICRRINNVWRSKESLIHYFTKSQIAHQPGPVLTMEDAHKRLTQYDGLGGFMAYEIVCDLRYTYLLENAPDKMTWCNPGPGCIRGLYRLAGEDWASKGNNAAAPPKPRDWQERMQRLLKLMQKRLPKMPSFEMREVEHILCEVDKYSRALEADGRLKRRFDGR